MFRHKLLAVFAPLAILACAESAAAATLTVTKGAACGCCEGWVEHMRKAGYQVVVRNIDDVTPTAKRLGVPDALRSCHTAEVGGYTVEGHVPAGDVKRLLATRPKAAGIAVPGMPIGSPGMEHGSHKEPYRTMLFNRAGQMRVFATH